MVCSACLLAFVATTAVTVGPGPGAFSEGECGQADQGCEESQLLNVQLLQQELHISSRPLNGNDVRPTTGSQPLLLEKRGYKKQPEETTETTTPDATGMTMNAVGDLEAFSTSMIMYGGATIFLLVAFSVLRLRYPLIFSNNVREKWAPVVPAETLWGWLKPTLGVSVDQVAQSVSLDHAMLLEFTHLCMKILVIVGTPIILVTGPLNCFLGGNAAGQDHMSYLSFGNVKNGSWLYWVHAFVVWGVVITVKHMVFSAQRRFLPLRFNWLRSLPPSRANTILVESIPDQYQSETALRDFFARVLPYAPIASVYIAKDTSTLLPMVTQCDKAQAALKEQRAKMEKDPSYKAEVRESFMGAKVDAISFYEKRIQELEKDIGEERERILKESKEVGGVNTSSGFITFQNRRDMELSLRLNGDMSPDQDEWEVYAPPEASDVQWNDLTQDDTAQEVRTHMGYLLVVGLFFVYLPCVIGLTNIAKIINLGPLQPLWAGLAPTFGLQVMVAFLPTFLLLIFQNFFTLRAAAWSQHKLQIWYFWFQVFFVILATAIGQNIIGFFNTLIGDPMSVFSVLAQTMPYATHFYMNFLVLQWLTHAMNLTRYVPLVKFKLAAQLYEEEDARQLSEPEDQDYYGMGARSARWSIMMSIGLVYGTLSPPINLLCFLNFALCRLVYGYLFCFAETKKPDLGGVFWNTQMLHMFVACIIYTVLMTGVLCQRAANYGPGIIVAPSIAYVAWSIQRFKTAFSWEKIPFEELASCEEVDMKLKSVYCQPEMLKS